MRHALLALAAAGVLLAGCIGGRGEAPPEPCGEGSAAGCSDAAESVLVGPGTFPLGTAYARVFDVPAGGRVQARLVYLRKVLDRARAWSWSSDRARHGLDPEPPLLLDYNKWILIRDVTTGSELRVSTLRAEEIDRTIIRNRMIVLDYDTDEGIRRLRNGNLFVDPSNFDTSARFPTDRFWPLPPADAVHARNPVDELFDQILASIRKADP